jgi:hypothetical protein
MAVRSATPPSTPPIIAPTGVPDPSSVGVGLGGDGVGVLPGPSGEASGGKVLDDWLLELDVVPQTAERSTVENTCCSVCPIKVVAAECHVETGLVTHQ